MASSDGEFFRTMIARVSPDDIVLYANRALAAYLRARKSDLVGSPLEVLAARARGEISGCFQRPTAGRTSNRLVTDADGRVFEVKTYSEGGVLDIVLDEVTTADSVHRDLRHVSGTSVDLLNEEELRTVRQPERRFMTVSHSRLHGLAHLAERVAPMELRLMLTSFVEESADAILETGCTYYQAAGESVVGLFGAPRYFADHALRALRAACNQIEKASQLRAGFFGQGKEMPPMSCGIWTGETFIGTLGSSATQHYSAVGTPVELAAELARLARPGEVLISETTLQSIIQSLPEAWQAIRAESESEPDLSDLQWTGDAVQPLPADLARGVWLIGPGVQEDTSRTEFYASYIYSIKDRALEAAVPVLRVVRPSAIGDSLELRSDNVVSTQPFQMLGKYKLLSVIGAGGMGKVWKGQDRYGNIVAIKVLHSAEAPSEGQIKRFKREAEIMSRLLHRNICRVFEMAEFEGIHYIVMEFVDGLTLADLLYGRVEQAAALVQEKDQGDIKSLIHALKEERSTREDSPPEEDDTSAPRPKETRILPVAQSLNLFLKICEAVQFAHEHGVLHRDLKPGNILLREDGEPLVADFGLAKLSAGENAQSLSLSGHVVGTLENMAPEQAESSKDVDERADVYALGTILFQMLTGRRHFEATGNIVSDAQALQTHEPPRPRSLNPRIDGDLEIILLKALRNSPLQRYRSAHALQSDIERYRRGEVIRARPVSAVELLRKLILRNRAVTAVLAASFLVFLTGSIAAFWKITERAKAAEAALEEAKKQERLAVTNEALAREQSEQALAAQRRAEEELAARKKLETQLSDAQKASFAARKETEQERKKREAAEAEAKKNASASFALEKANSTIEELKAARQEQAEEPSSRPPPPAPPDPAVAEQSNRALQAAAARFRYELSGAELARYERNPDLVLSRVSAGIDALSQLLLLDPSCAPAWVLKGRYHLACMELEQAKQSFDAATKCTSKNPATFLPEDPANLAALCEQLLQPSSDRFGKAVKMLRASGSPPDQTVADTIEFFGGKPISKRSLLGRSPLDRRQGQPEITLEIILLNGVSGRVESKPGANADREISISGIPHLDDLSPLKKLPQVSTRLRISDASSIDWASLCYIPIESLDLTGCPLDSIPPTARLLRLHTLSLKDTPLSDLLFVKAMPLLSSLDISGSRISDLSPLLACGRLQVLEAGGTAPSSLRPLAFLPLVRLTISPDKIADQSAFEKLRLLKRLKVLRDPGDPDEQAPAEFWKKFDGGHYGKPGG